MRVLILGAGGHAQVIADILLCAGEKSDGLEVIGYLDDNQTLIGQRRLGVPILGKLADLRHIDHDAVVLGIGDNGTRRRFFDHLLSEGESFATACHPRAIVARDVIIQPGSVVCAGAIVNPGSVIGRNVILNTGCTVDHHNVIGDHAHIAPGVHLGGDVHIGDGTLIGIGATVMPQRQVGEWSIVGAGALVQHDVPMQTLAFGVPAHVVRQLLPVVYQPT